MTILISDPRVAAIPLLELGEPLVALPSTWTTPHGRPVLVRTSLAERLANAQTLLPCGVRLRVIEGHRSAAEQLSIIAAYAAQLARGAAGVDWRLLSREEQLRLVSRYVAPLEVAPHVAGAAVDLTLVDEDDRPLDMGTEIDATPEESQGACFFAASGLSDQARGNRAVLALALGAAGLVNYPTEWWHWSYGDRYWALLVGAPHALYGPVLLESVA